jgi:hypothetical protein
MNPFYITGIIPPAYFCDRESETDWLVRTITNQANVLLTSPAEWQNPAGPALL